MIEDRSKCFTASCHRFQALLRSGFARLANTPEIHFHRTDHSALRALFQTTVSAWKIWVCWLSQLSIFGLCTVQISPPALLIACASRYAVPPGLPVKTLAQKLLVFFCAALARAASASQPPAAESSAAVARLNTRVSDAPASVEYPRANNGAAWLFSPKKALVSSV